MIDKNVSLEHKKVLITGVAGFIGANLAVSLLRTVDNIQIIGIDNLNDYYDVSLKKYRLKQIEEKAKEKNLTFSSYMVDCAVHGNNSITPQMAVRMQELVNMVLEIADSIDSSEYIRKEELRQKAHDLDGLFTSVSPQEKYENLEQKMGLFVEGGLDLWESLK